MQTNATTSNDYIAFVDGGSRGNPGPSASAYALYRNGTHVVTKGVYIGTTTNNEAEYRALEELLTTACLLWANFSHLTVFSDSALMVNQLTGKWATKDENLQRIQRGIFERIAVLSSKGTEADIAYVPREFNKEADKGVNETLDAEVKVAGGVEVWGKPLTHPDSSALPSEILEKLVHEGAFNRLRPIKKRSTFFKGGF